MRAGHLARAERVSHDDVLQGKARLKAQASRAQALRSGAPPSRRGRGRPWPASSAARREPGRSRGRGRARPRPRSRRRGAGRQAGQPRGRDVEGLLERRPVERIGLVEQRQHLKGAAGQEALQRELRPGDERFHQIAARPPRGSGRRTAGSASRRSSRATAAASATAIVGAHHAAAAGQHERLDHAGKADAAPRGHARRPPGRARCRTRPRRSAAVGSRRRADDRRPRTPRPPRELLAHEQLVRGGRHRRGAFAGRPSRRAAAAATFAGSSPPTGTTAEIGAAASLAAAIAAAPPHRHR